MTDQTPDQINVALRKLLAGLDTCTVVFSGTQVLSLATGVPARLKDPEYLRMVEMALINAQLEVVTLRRQLLTPPPSPDKPEVE